MDTTASIPFNYPATPRLFDKRTFLKHVKDIGKQYKIQGLELISISRTFAEASENTLTSYYELRSVLQSVDDALLSATDAGMITSYKADKAFENAIQALSEYERKYHPCLMESMITNRMAVAKGREEPTKIGRRLVGRRYKNRAMKLVSISTSFAQASRHVPSSYDEMRCVEKIIDDALDSATMAENKTSNYADAKFRNAIGALSAYGKKYHPTESVAHIMGEAEVKDKSLLTALELLVEKFRALKPELTISSLEPEPTFAVEFHIYGSLVAGRRTIVKQLLSISSNISEVLWNFYFLKDERRLTLEDNPHFYEELPTSRDAYGDNFSMLPIESITNFLRNNIRRGIDGCIRIDVLTDNLGQGGRVFIETSRKTRAFGNVCAPKNALIFKDAQGKLQGESNVSKEIQNIPLWCFTEPPPTSQSSRSSTPGSQSPTLTATPMTFSGFLLTDWRKPIYQMLCSPDVNIRILTKPPINFNSSSSASCPSPQSGISNSFGSLLPTPELPPADSPPRSPTSTPRT